ncbi:MAG TPA: alpha/beta fold hydrolase [Methylomirabilota bacterium]|nr:alpha/beta fold hydrolase [Methylomirabilota bacterium]
MSTRTIVLAAALLVLAIIPATRCAADASDTAVDQVFSALRDGNFSKATARFNHGMRATLTPAVLEDAWKKTYANEGPLLSWKIIERQDLAQTMGGSDQVRVQLNFQHSSAISMIDVDEISGKIGGIFFKLPRSNAPVTPPPYAEQTKFHSEDVTVGEYKLPGTLTVPKGAGPFPAAVLVHGSGPEDRDETIGPNHPFADIAQGLSSRGITVLRYDKRTMMYSANIATVDEEVIDDAVAAVNLLRTRRDVMADRIVVVGHSLGAMLAPEIAKKAAPVAGLVMLAPAGRKLAVAVVQQLRSFGATSGGFVETEREAEEISAHKMPASGKFMGAPASYFYDLDARDEVAIARSLDVPILILHGGRDYQVIDEDIQHWQDGLKGAPRVKVETFPTLNHLFIAGQGKPNPSEYDTPGHIDQAVIGAIADFVASGGASN